MQKKECHPSLKPFIGLVKLLGEMLPKEYEVVLHDVSGPETFIVEYVHGEVTGRDINSPLSDFGKFLIKSPEVDSVDYLANYRAESTNGTRMRSGVSLIRDDEGVIIGLVCINYDYSNAKILKDISDFLTHTEPLSFEEVKEEQFSHAKITVYELVDDMRRRYGKPLKYLTTEERKECVKYLMEEGFFNFKGSVEELAKIMNKSRYTLYADIRGIRDS